MLSKRSDFALGLVMAGYFTTFLIVSLFKAGSTDSRCALLYYNDITFLVFFAFIAFTINALIVDEVRSNRVKLWLSMPVTRISILVRSVRRAQVRILISLIVWILFLAILQLLTSGKLPENAILISFGIFQLAVISMLLALLITLFCTGELTLPIMILLPWLIHMLLILLEKEQSVTYEMIRYVVPIHSGYHNIIYGLSSSFGTQPSAGYINILSLGWMLVVSTLLGLRAKRVEY